MTNTNQSQKKKIIYSCIYALIIGLLIFACALVIAVASGAQVNPKQEIGGEGINVSTTTYVSPMQNATIVKDYSGTELQYNDTLKQWEIHKAVDFVAGENKNVYAVADGTVSNIYTDYLNGTVVEISHANGLVSIYKSLDKELSVTVGAKVGAGNVIGKVSDSMETELNTGAHLHLEMKQNTKLVDPNNYISFGDK